MVTAKADGDWQLKALLTMMWAATLKTNEGTIVPDRLAGSGLLGGDRRIVRPPNDVTHGVAGGNIQREVIVVSGLRFNF